MLRTAKAGVCVIGLDTEIFDDQWCFNKGRQGIRAEATSS